MQQTQNSNPCALQHNPAADSHDNRNKKTNWNACLFNARSIVNKLNNFQSYVYSLDLDIVALTETWLTDSIFNNEILPVDFAIYRKDRGSRGGGVMLAVRDCISSKLISSPDNLEIITVSVNTVHPTTFCAIYLPPNSLPEYAQLTFDYIKELCSTTASIIILGDLNLSDINCNLIRGISNLKCVL